jgi:hypothetical protein
VWASVQAEQLHWLLLTLLENEPNGVGTHDPDRQGISDGTG